MTNRQDVLRDVDIYGYRLTTWATSKRDPRWGKAILGYRMVHPTGWTIFEGEDFYLSPVCSEDSDESLRAILTFLTLRPGDTDREYFAGYTPEQLEWANSESEDLLNWTTTPPRDDDDDNPLAEFRDWWGEE